jgi:hemoglobin-like flavoprotein
MGTAGQQRIAAKQGAEDAGKYFRYMSEFVGFRVEDADVIRQTKPVVEKHLPNIVSKFYAHLLRYPPTRQWFLKADGTIDEQERRLCRSFIIGLGFDDSKTEKIIDIISKLIIEKADHDTAFERFRKELFRR